MEIHIAILTMGKQAMLDRLLSDLFWESVWGRVAGVHVLTQGGLIHHAKPYYHVPVLHILHSAENLGCAGGRKALTQRIINDYGHPDERLAIVYLDDDIEVLDAGWLPKLIDPLWTMYSICGVEGRRVQRDGLTVAATDDIDYVSGGWCAIRGDVFAAGCMFDEQFNPNYYEDVDLCFQARMKGMSIRSVGNVGLRHEHPTTPSAATLADLNRGKFLQKWGYGL
jgi:GT2 family glycosyltransferase